MNTAEHHDTDAAAAAPHYEPDVRWVPVDRRWCGLDRRSIGPTLAVLGLAGVLTVVIPAIDATVAYDDPVQPGDVMQVEGNIVFVPEPGWGITSGIRAGQAPGSGTYPDRASIVDGDVEFTLTVGEFSGDPNMLLDQVARTTDALTGGGGPMIAEERSTVITDAGDVGVLAPLADLQIDGSVAAFVFGDQGVVVRVTGPADGDPDAATAVTRMLGSIDHDERDAA